MRCHENSSRRIFVLKLIFLLYRVDFGSNYRKIMGFKFPYPSTPLGGGGPFPPIDSTPVSANNAPIFTIINSVVLWISDYAESIYETLEVPRSGYNRLPVTIDIGHQSSDHYHGSDEPSHIVSLSMVFWAR